MQQQHAGNGLVDFRLTVFMSTNVRSRAAERVKRIGGFLIMHFYLDSSSSQSERAHLCQEDQRVIKGFLTHVPGAGFIGDIMCGVDAVRWQCLHLWVYFLCVWLCCRLKCARQRRDESVADLSMGDIIGRNVCAVCFI